MTCFIPLSWNLKKYDQGVSNTSQSQHKTFWMISLHNWSSVSFLQKYLVTKGRIHLMGYHQMDLRIMLQMKELGGNECSFTHITLSRGNNGGAVHWQDKSTFCYVYTATSHNDEGLVCLPFHIDANDANDVCHSTALWRIERPDVLQSMGSWRVGPELTSEQQQPYGFSNWLVWKTECSAMRTFVLTPKALLMFLKFKYCIIP